MKFETQPEQFPLLVRTYAGLEEVLLKEIASLGGANTELLTRAVSCTGDKGFVYKLNLGLRTALRVLKPLHSFTFNDNDSFYKAVNSIAWEEYFSVEKTFAIDSIVFSRMFNNSMFVSQLTKDAIADRFRKHSGKRPFVDSREPEISISVYVREQEATIYLDSGGESLHRRGYRTEQVKAPLSEVMAAGILKLSGWSHHFPLIDPMCGSGTFSIEAALMGSQVPPGLFREHFSFMHWLDFDPELFDTVRESLVKRISDDPLRIKAADVSRRALSIARENASRADVASEIQFELQDFTKSSSANWPDGSEGTKKFIFINPPYGERLQPENLEQLYQQIGSTLKHQYSGCEAFIFTSHPDVIRLIGLKPSKRWKLYNGKLECQLLHYSLYAGSRKKS